MRTFELFGHDLSFTASPVIHRAALRHLGLQDRYDYVVTDVARADFPRELARFRVSGAGANVTTPHKIVAAEACDELSHSAELMRAVNTLVRVDGRLVGHNTDLPALVDELRALCPDGIRKAVVLGAGGASRSAQAALYALDAACTVLRKRDRSVERVAQVLPGADLLINATPVGTMSNEMPLDPSLLHPGLAVFDMVYRPTPTALVAAARKLGAPARAGAGMLVGQAWRSLSLWLAQDGIEVGAELAAPMMEAVLAEVGADRV